MNYMYLKCFKVTLKYFTEGSTVYLGYDLIIHNNQCQNLCEYICYLDLNTGQKLSTLSHDYLTR